MLNWKHIKGFYGNSTYTTYTYFEFQNRNSSSVSIEETLLPCIFITSTNTESPSTDYNFGHIVTNNVLNTFYKDVYIRQKEGQAAPNLYVLGSIYFSADRQEGIYFANNALNLVGLQGINIIAGEQDDVNINADIIKLNATDSTEINSALSVGDSNHSYNSTFYGTATISDYCKALYFDSTSDLRAKENLKPVKQSMLDLVNYMPIYTFNYKNKPEQRNLGIIAQDVQNINIDGFSLVENKNASGEDDDFMSIHESKLVYILLGAIQELSKQVEELKKKIGE